MEAPTAAIDRSKRRFRTRYASIIIVGVIAALSIVIALSIVLPKRTSRSSRSIFILLPLYIYPNTSNWNPLYEVLRDHQDVNFTVILNPNDGPGLTSSPGPEYLASIQNLTIYRNVRTVGYVRTGWSSRNLSSVLMDVATYSGWRDLVNDTSSMSVHGIFFDETPSEYTPASAEYLQKINKAVKTAPGIAAEKFVIHNPGTITDPRLQDDSTDLTVVFENSYDEYKKQESVLSSLPEDRSRYAYLIHSISTISGRNLKRFVQSISKHAEALFLTSLQEDYYEAFGSQWKEVVQAMDDLNGS